VFALFRGVAETAGTVGTAAVRLRRDLPGKAQGGEGGGAVSYRLLQGDALDVLETLEAEARATPEMRAAMAELLSLLTGQEPCTRTPNVVK
jgi:hypothetical protein